MINAFDYEQTTRIVFGRGKVSEIGTIALSYGKTAMLVTVPEFPALSSLYEQVKKSIEAKGVNLIHYDQVVPNPTTESVDAGTKIAREQNVDVVIGLGGGSSMDTAKAIAVAAINEGEAWDYLFFKEPQPAKTLPCIAISTTSGTGSQVTQVAVMTETETSTKSAIYNNLLYPEVAIVDPELMLTIPKHITASTGFDAFTHCFESYINTGGSIYTDAIAIEGIKAVVKHLRNAVADGDDLEAREGMAWADVCGGLAIANAGVTLPHGIGMTISGHCSNIMHGESLALTYPSFTRLTAPGAVEKFATVGRIFNPELNNVSDEEAAKGCCDEIDQLLKDIGMWISFKDYDVSLETIRKIADRSHDLPDYKANPVIASIEEIYEQLVTAYERV